MEKKIGFIGCGNMGTAMIQGILESGKCPPQEMMISCRTKKTLEEKKAAAQARIMETMGTAERGGYGSYSVTWKTQKRSTFDRKKWEKDHGEIPQDYFKSSESRTFRFKKENI